MLVTLRLVQLRRCAPQAFACLLCRLARAAQVVPAVEMARDVRACPVRRPGVRGACGVGLGFGLAGRAPCWAATCAVCGSALPSAAQQSAATLARVYGPKAHAAWSLQRGCAEVALGACALFSSVAALLGGAGQANYAAANSCLDALAAARRAAGQSGVSVQWGPWAEVGMAAGGAGHARVGAQGWGLIGLSEGLAALGMAVGGGTAAGGGGTKAGIEARLAPGD